MKSKKDDRKILASNRQARHEYFIEDVYEAGISLIGTEVKSIRQGKVNLKDSFVVIKDGQAVVHNMHISPYEQGNRYNTDPLRNRTLLLHKSEIRKLDRAVSRDGMTLVPLELYLKKSYVKVALAVAKGKKLYDKRQAEAERDAKRSIERSFHR